MLLRGVGATAVIAGLMFYAVEGGGSRQEIIHGDIPEPVTAINDTRGCPEYGSYAAYPQYESPVLTHPD
jgi:hypothetical protein